MGIKGDRASKEPIAIRMYADGKSLTEISKILNVSITTLSEWKTSTRYPDKDIDEWDRAKQQKRGMIQRLKDLYEEQMAYLESLHPSERSSMMMDALSKLGSLVEQRDKVEREIFKKIEKAVSDADTTKEDMQRTIKEILESEYGIS